MYQGRCAFRYNQIEELKKTWKYRDSEGVCFGMSLDWLRRKMFNLCNPLAKPKRDFNDHKYNSNSKRIHLTKKHGKLQDAYQGSKASGRGNTSTSVHISAMVAANVVKAGLDRLTVKQFQAHQSHEFDESPATRAARLGTANAHLGFADKLKDFVDRAAAMMAKDGEPAVGIFFHMEAKAAGHAVAFVLTPIEIRFFDPNIGEFFFDYSTERIRAIQFVSLLWFDVYHRYYNFDKMEFELLSYA